LAVESTYEEALAVRDFALNQGWDRLMIVTDPYHSFRTRFIFRRELQDSEIGDFDTPSCWALVSIDNLVLSQRRLAVCFPGDCKILQLSISLTLNEKSG